EPEQLDVMLGGDGIQQTHAIPGENLLADLRPGQGIDPPTDFVVHTTAFLHQLVPTLRIVRILAGRYPLRTVCRIISANPLVQRRGAAKILSQSKRARET